MDHETLVNLQGYVKFFFILAIFIIFYSYAYSIYKRDKTGERNFEKYTDLVHDDAIESSPLEERKEEKKNKEKEI
jgi:cytochrome c oxidase cbb3-type subunit 4